MATVRGRGEQPPSAISVNDSYGHFKRSLAGSKWEVLRGWHLLRHSFISACASKGVDQRLINEWCGHTTEDMRKRYRHLHANVTRNHRCPDMTTLMHEIR